MGHAVELLARIYASKDTMFIRAVNAALQAFCEAVDQKHADQHKSRLIDKLNARLESVEKQLQEKTTVKQTRIKDKPRG